MLEESGFSSSRILEFLFPEAWRVNTRLFGNKVFQLRHKEEVIKCKMFAIEHMEDEGKAPVKELIRILKNEREIVLTPYINKTKKRPEWDGGNLYDIEPETFGRLLRNQEVDNEPIRLISLSTRMNSELSCEALSSAAADASMSWSGKFLFKEEDTRTGTPGLRAPQVGAIFAALAHWKISSDPATIVLPTGVGKTETMLGLMHYLGMKRLLVVVPTDPLRTQLSKKFTSFGILEQLSVISHGSEYPVVGLVEHGFTSTEEVAGFFQSCNVVIATMGALSKCSEEIQEVIAQQLEYCFIDEAHHVPARTWNNFKSKLSQTKVLQFTATPYREDGKTVDGKIIFNYPLGKAQLEGYFKNIEYHPIHETDQEKADRAIAQKAIALLDQDLASGCNHILLARTSYKSRTAGIAEIYKQLKPEYEPVVIHSGLSKRERDEALQKVQAHISKIVICVDMLGEGYDLPELKICAIHDPHRSLTITLQFIGRFTRTKTDIGNAKVVANALDFNFKKSLGRLYDEDANWNKLIKDLSQDATEQQVECQEFFEDFQDIPAALRLQLLTPKMSTVIFRANKFVWNLTNIDDCFRNEQVVIQPKRHKNKNLGVFVTKVVEHVSWTHTEVLKDSSI
jgi:superfamily II DNA or RNA helicase